MGLMVIKTVVHFEIPANDTAKLSKFYADTFGWKFSNPNMPGMEYWMVSTGPQAKSVSGGMYKKMGPTDGPRNYIGVDDIDSAIAAFKANGGTEVQGKQEIPGMGWSFLGADPEGNLLGMFQGTRPTRPARRAAKKARKAAPKGKRSR
jgi:predicted enzyme related to lactoylglutathione lyase